MADSDHGKSSDMESELDISAVKNSVWLVKVPTFLADKLTKTIHGQNIGNMKINTDKSIELSIQTDGVDSEAYQFVLEDMTSSSSTDLKTNTSSSSQAYSEPTWLSFVYDEDKTKYSVQGTITKRSRMQPKIASQYSRIISEKVTKQASEVPASELKSISDLETNTSSHVIDFIPPVQGELRRKTALDAGRSDGQPSSVNIELLRSKVFEAFSNQKLQSFKDLQLFCRDVEGGSQKDKEIKLLLDKYARYHRSGPHRGSHQLKPEYESVPQPSSSSSSASP